MKFGTAGSTFPPTPSLVLFQLVTVAGFTPTLKGSVRIYTFGFGIAIVHLLMLTLIPV